MTTRGHPRPRAGQAPLSRASFRSGSTRTVVADGRGRWDLAVLLFPGENIFTFRLNGDIATDVTYTLYYEPL